MANGLGWSVIATETWSEVRSLSGLLLRGTATHLPRFPIQRVKMLRNILAVIAGFLGGGIFVFVFESIGHWVYPIPVGLDVSNPDAIADYVSKAPVGAILSVLIAQSAGSFFGGLITGLIAVAKTPTAIIYGALALMMAGLNALMIAHPVWFLVPSLLLPIPLSLLGSRCSGVLQKKALQARVSET
jgi:hypothetical protein